MANNIISTGLNTGNTIFNSNGGILISGDAVKGGYFVTDTIANIPTWANVKGTLCFCEEDSKFYQYNGTDWIEQTQAAAVASNLNTHVNTKTGNPHNVTKANVGLGSVVNTGDSATPIEGGTTKFTTGGAYTELNKKVDKVSGKGLSTNDYTTTEKNKLAGIAEGANKTIIDSSLSSTSANPVQNKIVKGALDDKANASDLSSHTENTTIHITTDERTKWNAAKTHADGAHAPSNAEKNQNAFSNIAVSGQTTISADTTTDTLTLVAGNNVTITTDATNDKVTIAAKDTVYTHPTHTAKSSGLYKITVDSSGHISDATAVQKSDITALGIPAQDTVYTHPANHDDRYYTESEIDTKLAAKADTHTHPYIPTSEKGVTNGVATLDASGKVPTAQLPSYVDDVLEYSAKSAFPATGETGKIYVDTATNKTYRWSGSTYTEISASLALGETSSTAYYGDKGKIAYDHSQAAHAPTNAEANQNAFSNIKIGDVTIAAETETDTVTLVAGTNITLTPDATNDKITVSATDTVYTHPSYTVRTGKPTTNQTPAFGGTATVSQVTSDSSGHVTNMTDRTIKIPDTLSNGTSTAGLIKTSSTVTSTSGYTAAPVINGVPYYKDTNTTYSAGTGLALSGTKFSNEAALYYATNVTVDQAGSSTKNEYLASKWSVTSVDGITVPIDGMSIAIRTPAAGFSGGILFSIDGGTTYYPIVRNVNTLVTTTYAAGSTIIVTFNSTQTASPYTTAGTTSTVTGCWQTADYDANTKTTTGTANKVATKLFLAGAASQSSSGATTYSNKNVYIDTDNCLYSNSSKVSTVEHTHSYSGTTGSTEANVTVASTDAGHTHSFSANLANGSAAANGKHTHTVTPTGTVTSTDAGHTHDFEASLESGTAVSAGSHTHAVTAKGSVSITEPTDSNSVKGHAHTASSTFIGTAAAQKFTGSEVTSGAPSSTVTVAAQAHTHSYTPAGSVSSHTHTIGNATTTTIKQVSSVGTLPSHTAPSLSMSVSNKRLTITFSAGSFSAGTLPTSSDVTVVTGIPTATGSTTPTFTGTAATIAKTGTTGTSVAKSDHTHKVTAAGTNGSSTVTGTVTTTVDKATTGVTATFTGSSATSASSGSHVHTVTGTVSGTTESSAADITSTFKGNSNTTSEVAAHTHIVSGSVSGTSGSGKASITNTVTDPGHTHSYSGTSGSSN